jgi:hypothetical protein
VFAAAMLVSPFVLGFTGSAKFFFVGIGTLSIIVVALTDFSGKAFADR